LWELAALEDVTAAEKTYQQITRLAPDFDFPSYQIFKALHLWITGDVEGAENEFQRVSERAQGYGPWTQEGINMTLVNFEVFKGQFKPGLGWIEKNFAFTQKINSMEGQATLISQKGLFFKELGNKPAFENEHHKLLEQFPEPLSSMGAAWLAYDKVQAGQISESEAYLEQLKNSALNPLEKQAFVHLIEGRIAQATNQIEAAIKHFQQAKQLVKVTAGHPPPYFYSALLPNLALAEVYEQNHQLDKAIEIRQDIIAHKIQSFYPGFVMDPFEWIKAHYHLGRLYELKGDREKATEYYQEFLGYWSGADQPLPEIQAAKDKLARLSEGK
jgi:tetratricopeptide (TPR) repeat protein